MSTHDAGFDARARDVHAQSLDHLSPRVQAQLAQRRRAALQGTAPRRTRSLLPWAGMATAGLALVLAMQLRLPGIDPTGGAQVASNATTRAVGGIDTRMAARTDADAIAPDLAQDPEFYLWLGDMRPADAE